MLIALAASWANGEPVSAQTDETSRPTDSTADGSRAIDLGSRRELFVDDSLLQQLGGRAELKLHHPTPREVAITFDQPWEGNASGYPTVFQDGDVYRMWYRGHRYILDDKPLRQAQTECVCYAESRDGIVWTKPKLGLWAWNGSKENNIIWMGDPAAHNFAPFKDTNPTCPPDERYKALGGTVTSKGLLAFKSADGIHWSKISESPVFTKGAFDSHNTSFWDAERGRYAMYLRFFSDGEFRGLRSIGMTHSTDFRNWSDPMVLSYPNSPPQQMYTNQIGPYPRASHILLGFPTRFVARPLTDHARRLEPVETRAKFAASVRGSGSYSGAEVTDGLFMASRDGLTFRRWDEAFLRPGPQAEGRWIYGDNYQSYGLWETKAASPGMPNEISMHFNEGAWRDEMHRLRRYTIRLDGFVSLHAPLAGGDVTTKPLLFSGQRLSLNYATSAAGSVRLELQDATGQPIPGFSLADAEELYGDSIDQQVAWKNGTDVSSLSGKPVRLRFVLRDADVFSFRFAK
jgi:hypothetical protein